MHTWSQKSSKQTSKSDSQKQANLPSKIFDYMYTAKCQRFFFLSWYNNQTYAPAVNNITKPLPIFCCNGFCCQSKELNFLKRKPFVQTSSIKYTKSMKEWITCRIAALKEWKKAKSKALWLEDGIEDPMPDTVRMSEQCLLEAIYINK